MEENRRKVVLVALAVACFAGAAVVFVMNRSKGGDLDVFKGQVILLMCKKSECGHVFEMDKKQYYEYLEANRDPTTLSSPPAQCPECGENSGVRAVRCEKCEEVFFYGAVQGMYRDTCPKCSFSREKEDRLKAAQERGS